MANQAPRDDSPQPTAPEWNSTFLASEPFLNLDLSVRAFGSDPYVNLDENHISIENLVSGDNPTQECLNSNSCESIPVPEPAKPNYKRRATDLLPLESKPLEDYPPPKSINEILQKLSGYQEELSGQPEQLSGQPELASRQTNVQSDSPKCPAVEVIGSTETIRTQPGESSETNSEAEAIKRLIELNQAKQATTALPVGFESEDASQTIYDVRDFAEEVEGTIEPISGGFDVDSEVYDFQPGRQASIQDGSNPVQLPSQNQFPLESVLESLEEDASKQVPHLSLIHI